ncbi:hypothetical protein DV515_00002433 [Chloebia gouldiae]|uniref:Uncharacterized protein n=1 Tax=Chloebia gouldiae TaxID=44316 RepID=A0A3L8SW08_CHLGU|nr:hypothetical protein DV515_00002433 [Chloebia gouldiae]
MKQVAQAPTSNTGGVAELKAEQVKSRCAICASPQTNMNNLQHSQFHHASKQKTTSEEPWNAKTLKERLSLHTHTKMLLIFGDLQEWVTILASLLLSTMAVARLKERSMKILCLHVGIQCEAEQEMGQEME